MILDQKIKIKWGSKNKKHFVGKGYPYTAMGEEFEVEVKDLMPEQNVDILLQCDYCGKNYSRNWRKYYKNHYSKNDFIDLCDECQGSVIRYRDDTLESWQKCVENFCLKNNYTLVTELKDIINRDSRLEYICPIHGLRETNARSAKDNHLCYECTRSIAFIQYRKNTAEERHEALYQKCMDFAKESGYKFLTPKNGFKVSGDWIEYECPIHGKQSMRVGNFANKRHCMNCTNANAQERYKMPIEEVQQRIEKCYGRLLNPEDYINQSTRNLLISCPECGKPFTTSLVLFTQHGGQVCEKCESNESMGERIIRLYLEEKQIPFEQEKWFPDCRDQRPLPFDFYLQPYDTIIEFDGYQHFYQTDLFEYSLEEIQRHDQIKNQYCYDNGINLIRIPYWRINKVAEILNEEFEITT